MNLQEPNGRAQEPGDRSSQVTLESWKEIAAYLQRDAKTASRWEKEAGLPIHRHREIYSIPSADFQFNYALTSDSRSVLLAKKHGDHWETHPDCDRGRRS